MQPVAAAPSFASRGGLPQRFVEMTEPVSGCEDDDWYDRLLSRIGRSEALDQRVAAHEASHAVALRLLDWPVGSVTVDPGDTYEGLLSGPSYSMGMSLSYFRPCCGWPAR